MFFSLQIWIIAVVLVLLSLGAIFAGPSIVSRLILKYLLKRRIAWVALAAVMLCTTMVVVVRSVMGGWLDMFRQSFHGLTGDIVIEGGTLSGFPHYQEIIDRTEKLPEVEAAVPTIHAFALINIANRKSDGVQVQGIPVEKIGRVNAFRESLFRQHKGLLDDADNPKTPPARAALLRKAALLPPTFDLRNQVRAPLDTLPPGVDLAAGAERLRYDANQKALVFTGVMNPSERDDLLKRSLDGGYQEAVRYLYDRTAGEVIDYKSILPNARGDVTRYPGMIASVGVLDIKRDKDGKAVGRDAWKFELPAKLIVLGMQPGSASVDMAEKAERNFWMVDDSRTGVSLVDSKTVYVPFDVLQSMLGMGEKTGIDKATKAKVTEPARATDIQVKVRSGADLQAVKTQIAAIVTEVFNSHDEASASFGTDPTVETWEEDKAAFISAIENETVLVTGLFAIISVVAVFLIFCIFYMIVVEKTRDIGIIKSVGATANGVAGIFLGYGLAIGLVGGALGLLMSYLIVTNINYLHTRLAELMGRQIWNPEVYLFDKIPNKLEPAAVSVIIGAMIVASVVGALIPAIVAAAKKPVEALRWE